MLSTAVKVGVDCRSVSADVVDSVCEPLVDVAVVETSQLLYSVPLHAASATLVVVVSLFVVVPALLPCEEKRIHFVRKLHSLSVSLMT